MSNFKKIENRGATLIEILLYVGIASTVLFLVSLFVSVLIRSRIKNQTVAEVEQQGLAAMQAIAQAVRNAEAINSPSVGFNSSLLSLDAYDSGSDPTVFDLSGGSLRIAEGAGSPVALTNSRVTVSGLDFYNLSRSDTPGIVRIQLTIFHNNPSGRNEYEYERTFYKSAALRWP